VRANHTRRDAERQDVSGLEDVESDLLSTLARLAAIFPLLMATGCADHSRGAALNACHLQHYMQSPAKQAELVPACMRAKSFALVPECSVPADADDWTWQVRPAGYDYEQCYKPIGTKPWIATALSPM
jgi:hypothetical protein